MIEGCMWSSAVEHWVGWWNAGNKFSLEREWKAINTEVHENIKTTEILTKQILEFVCCMYSKGWDLTLSEVSITVYKSDSITVCSKYAVAWKCRYSWIYPLFGTQSDIKYLDSRQSDNLSSKYYLKRSNFSANIEQKT